MSWQRLGVPKSLAKYIIDLDSECLTIPLTPHAMKILSKRGIQAFGQGPSTTKCASGFFPETGTSQGDTPSPTNWNASLDVLLRALHAIDPTPFMVRTENKLSHQEDTAYADDLFSISARREGLQKKADIVSAFTIIFGLKIAIHKLRSFAKCWGEEPSNQTLTDYDLLVHDTGWISTAIPVVYIDVNNRFKRQHKATMEMIRKSCISAKYRRASAETITTVMNISPYRKASFPGKLCPWSLKDHRALDTPVNQLYKHHLHLMQSTSNAALDMAEDVGGMNLPRLSDQILLDKWAMIWRGLRADSHTRIATEGLLHRAMRTGQTLSDSGFSSSTSVAGIPQLLTGLLEASEKCGLRLTKGGLPSANTPSHPILDQLNLRILTKQADKLMNARIITIGDLITFNPDSTNSWSTTLIRHLIPDLEILLPHIPPEGHRIIRTGQYWSSNKLQGHEGHLIEILGLIDSNTVNGRRWIPVIPRDTEFPTGVLISPPGKGRQIWVRPAFPGSSRGAGATEEFTIADLFTGNPHHLTLGPETTATFADDQAEQRDGIARQVLHSSLERPPLALPSIRNSVTRQDYNWIQLLGDRTDCQVEVFTDGSMRFPGTALEHAFPQPKFHQRATYAQGGILFVFDSDEEIHRRRNDISVTTTKGLELGLRSPASIELYTILQALHTMEMANMSGVIHTDYKKIVSVSKNPLLLNKMGRKANLPLFEIILLLLSKNPMNSLEHVKAHGSKTKLAEWTRAQWGNLYADAIAKDQTDTFSKEHMEMSLIQMKKIIMSQNSSLWKNSSR